MHPSLLQIDSKYPSTEIFIELAAPAIRRSWHYDRWSGDCLVSTVINGKFQAGNERNWSFLETGHKMFVESFTLGLVFEISMTSDPLIPSFLKKKKPLTSGQ